MARAVRRIVTGHHRDGRSTAVLDGPAPNVKQREAGNASTPPRHPATPGKRQKCSA